MARFARHDFTLRRYVIPQRGSTDADEIGGCLIRGEETNSPHKGKAFRSPGDSHSHAHENEYAQCRPFHRQQYPIESPLSDFIRTKVKTSIVLILHASLGFAGLRFGTLSLPRKNVNW